MHRVSAEVKNPSNAVVCRVNGEWNGTLEFSYASVSTIHIKIFVVTYHIKRYP